MSKYNLNMDNTIRKHIVDSTNVVTTNYNIRKAYTQSLNFFIKYRSKPLGVQWYFSTPGKIGYSVGPSSVVKSHHATCSYFIYLLLVEHSSKYVWHMGNTNNQLCLGYKTLIRCITVTLDNRKRIILLRLFLSSTWYGYIYHNYT